MIHATLVIIGLVVTSVILGILLGVQLRDWQYGRVDQIEKELRDMDVKHGDIMDRVKSRELTENLNVN